MIYRFDDIEIDTAGYRLRRNGEPVAIEPLVFDLLLHFLRHPGRVFSRDELIAAVWSGRVVSDATVSGAIKSLRKALGDSGGARRYVKTLHGRGFRFDADPKVTVADAAPPPRTGLVREPVLLILPPAPGDEMRDYREFALDLAEDLARILTRIPLLRISAQGARYADPQSRPTARQIHDEIGVHFIAEFSLRRRGGEMRLNLQLSDARAGVHLWAEQISRPLEREDLYDALLRDLIARLEPQLNRAILQLVRAGGDERNSRQLFLEASGLLALKGWHGDSFLEAAALLRRSVELEPDFAHAWAYLALILAFGHRVGLIGEREQSLREARDAAERALELDSMDSTVLGFAGCALCDIGMQSRGIPILKNAVERNPANGQAWVALGAACLSRQELGAAIEHLGHGIRISPLDSRLSVWGALLALCHLLAGDLEAAVAEAERAAQHDHRNYLPRLVLAAVRLRQRDAGAAAAALRDAWQVKPDLSPPEIAGIVGERVAARLLELRDEEPERP